MELLITTSLFITGLYTLTSYERDLFGRIDSFMPLYKLRLWSEKILGEYWTRPLFGCVVCMSSFWGMVFYCTNLILVSDKFGFYTVFNCIIFIIALAGIQKIVCHLINEC